MIIALYLLITAAVNAQIELTPVSCTGIDDIKCNELKKKEAARVNLINGKLFIEALKNCRPIKTNEYIIDKLFKTQVVEGKVGDKCKMIISVVSSPAKQVCLFDQADMALMKKDPKAYTPQEQEQSDLLFNQQRCKAEIDPNHKDAEEFQKMSQYIEKSQQEMRQKFIDETVKELNHNLSVLKASCLKGDKKACAELDQIKKDLPNECKKPQLEGVCDKLTIP